MIIGRITQKFRKQRRGAQLIEEALLLSVALVALSLLVGGVDSILKQAGSLTSNIWTSISSNLNNLFSSAFKW
jgi:Flp pilus assembly pilin Flp